jgi:SAM-dependent methyltransferase
MWPYILRWAEEARAGVGKIRDILEIGCGTGETLMCLESVGFSVRGIDASSFRVERARRISDGPILELAVERLDRSSFGAEFDLVIGHHVLEHLFDPNELFIAVKRVLREGGFLFLAVPNVFRSSLLSVFHAVAHPQAFTPESLLCAVHKHGFIVQRLTVGDEVHILARLGKDRTIFDDDLAAFCGPRSYEHLEGQLQELLPPSCKRYEVGCSYRAKAAQSRCTDPACTRSDHRPQTVANADGSLHPGTALVEVLGSRVGFPVKIVDPCCDARPVWVK